MAKKNNRRPQPPRQAAAVAAPRPASPAAPSPQTLANDASTVAVESLQHAEAAGNDGTLVSELELLDTPLDTEALRTAYLDARTAQARYVQLSSEVEKAQAAREATLTREEGNLERRKSLFGKKEDEFDQRKSEAQKERLELDADRALFEKGRKDQAQKDADLAGRERLVHERELEAEAGFAKKNRDALTALDGEKTDLDEAVRTARAQLLTVQQEIRDVRSTWDVNQNEHVQTALSRLEAEKSTVETDRAELDAERAQLKKLGRDIALREADIDDDRQAIDAAITHGIGREHARLQIESERLNARVSALVDQVTAREKEVAALQASQRRAQGRSPEELVQERDALQRKVDELEVALAERPGADDLQKLRDLERTRESEQLHLDALRQQTAALQLKADRADLNAVEVSSLRALKESYEAKLSILSEELRLLGGSIEKYHGTHGPFPLCSRLDAEPESTRDLKLQTVDKIGGLAVVADKARSLMALREPALFYDEKTVRLFLAGLATSHLVLLEGISGTGKSSLPEAFAEAIGGVSQSIAVQASWRDRHDLLGHHNTFERKFAESDLLRHLYQAQLPAYADRPFLVVLDEMNLARPEYYFADFLSKLEDRARLGPDGEVFLGLVDNELAGMPLPRLLRRASDGISVKLPDNVWFVGTANQDESTLKFAPKTYDRAHVMELPRSPGRFAPARPSPMDLSWASLEDAFQKAAGTPTAPGTHSAVADEVWTLLTTTWEGRLSDDFKLSWGNRLERQVRRFAPVLAAAGGSATEAVDHLLTTKVLSKIKGRFDLDADKLEALIGDLDAADLPEAQALAQAELDRIEA